MQLLFALCQWLEDTAVGTSVRQSSWQFPVIEIFHLLGLILLVGSGSILDLRLIGLAFTQERVSTLARRTLPWAWTGIVIEFVTGFLLFVSEATKMYHSRAFLIKMVLIFLAGLNVLVFHNLVYKSVGTWEEEAITPKAAQFAGALSLVLWVAIVSAGVWIPYF
jgi:hypothetical protein